MKEFTFHIPVRGTILTKIVAKDAEEAINVLLERKDDIIYHPKGVLIPQIEKMIIYHNEIKETN